MAVKTPNGQHAPHILFSFQKKYNDLLSKFEERQNESPNPGKYARAAITATPIICCKTSIPVSRRVILIYTLPYSRE